MHTTTRSQNWFWGGEEPEWLVVLTLVIALALGAALVYGLAAQTSALTLQGASVRYPADWHASTASESGALRAGPALGARAGVALQVLRDLDPAAPVTLDELAAQREFAAAQTLDAYRTLSSESKALDGKSGLLVRYADVQEAPGRRQQATLPAVIVGMAWIGTSNGKAYVISLEDEAAGFAANERRYLAILNGARLR